jgi:2'-5' RNA ligase
MRLFFAALPSPDIGRRLESVARALPLPSQARQVPVENYHMTLAFAGAVSNAQAAALRTLGAVLRSPAFEVCFDAYEYWPKSEVLVLAASCHPSSLHDLHQLLRAEFLRLGIAADSTLFRAHVTLARKVTQAPVLKAMSPFCWRVQALHLVHSSRSAAGSVYTVVDTWPLLDTAPRGE